MIELAADGSFTATNVPSKALALAPEKDKNPFAKLSNGSGRCRVGAVGGVDNGLGQKPRWDVHLESSTAEREAFGLAGARPPYGLIFNFGDPDLGQAMIYRREN